MDKYIVSNLGNCVLLSLYGQEPYEYSTISSKWYELTHPWTSGSSAELGDLRQIMLKIDKEVAKCQEECQEQ